MTALLVIVAVWVAVVPFAIVGGTLGWSRMARRRHERLTRAYPGPQASVTRLVPRISARSGAAPVSPTL
jgi:hypothetical protein